MAERVREPEGIDDQARPVGCPWQLLCRKTQQEECRVRIANREQDTRCFPRCDMYQHLVALDQRLRHTQEELHDAKCKEKSARG